MMKALTLTGCVHLWILAAVLWISHLCVLVPGTFLALQLYIFICADAFINCESRRKPVRIHACGRKDKSSGCVSYRGRSGSPTDERAAGGR